MAFWMQSCFIYFFAYCIIFLSTLLNQVQKVYAEDTLVELTKLHPHFNLDIRYATTDNFFEKKAYPVARCFLKKEYAQKLVAAQNWLDANHTGLKLLFKDCYRPHSVQKILWEAVKGTPKAKYVANPYGKKGSVHSYGAAVDVTLLGKDGKELDMGTPYDFLGALAEPQYEARFLKEKKLSEVQIHNRKILREAVVKHAEFRSISNEWWHFDAVAQKNLRVSDRLDIPLESID